MSPCGEERRALLGYGAPTPEPSRPPICPTRTTPCCSDAPHDPAAKCLPGPGRETTPGRGPSCEKEDHFFVDSATGECVECRQGREEGLCHGQEPGRTPSSPDPVIEAIAHAIGNVLITRGSTYEAARAALDAIREAGWTVMRPLTPEEALDDW